MPIDLQSLLFLLLPVAAASGWWLAKRKERRVTRRSSDINRDYLRGLSFLASNDSDKAIEVFLRLAEVDSDTVETHLALGHLFRRRGEVDRALRVHESLMSRPQLSRHDRQHAMYALGQDYLGAGMLDYAERCFMDLATGGPYAAKALKKLLIIYEREREWQRAIDTCERLDTRMTLDSTVRLAHYYCELAREAAARGDNKELERRLRKAAQVDPKCVRVNIVWGDRFADQEQWTTAIDYWQKVLDQNLDFAPEVIPRLMQAYFALDIGDNLEPILENLLENYSGLAPALALATLSYRRGNIEAAEHYLLNYVDRDPNALGLGQVLYSVLNTGQTSDSMMLQKLRDALASVLNNSSAYQCYQCGYSAKKLHWQCPSCEDWNTVLPSKHRVELPFLTDNPVITSIDVETSA